MFTRKIIAGAAGLFLVAGGTVGALAAHAEGAGAGACAVTSGRVSVDNPITATTGGGTGKFTSTTIQCEASDAEDSGIWSGISANFHDTAETPAPAVQNCASEQGEGDFTGGTAPGGSAGDGTVTGGHFTYERVGTHVNVTGHIKTTDSSGAVESHQFAAELEFTPDPATQTCVTGITTADLQGAAQVSEGTGQ